MATRAAPGHRPEHRQHTTELPRLARSGDRYIPILMVTEERLETLESDIVVAGSDSILAELISTKTMLKKMHRTQIYHCNTMRDWREGLKKHQASQRHWLPT